MMITKPFTVFTKVATARILSLPEHLIKEVRIFAKVIWVRIKGQRPTFVSKSKYQRDFVETRVERSFDIEVTPVGAFSYDATNKTNRNTYRLWCEPGLGLRCECKDFERQVLGGRVNPTCKHKIAVQQFQNETFPAPKPQPTVAVQKTPKPTPKPVRRVAQIEAESSFEQPYCYRFVKPSKVYFRVNATKAMLVTECDEEEAKRLVRELNQSYIARQAKVSC